METATRSGRHFQPAERTADFSRLGSRSVGSDLDRAATLRVANAECRCDQAETDRNELLQLLQQTEENLAAAQNQLIQQRIALRETRLREERLMGRLEEREVHARVEAPSASEQVEAAAEDSALPGMDVAEQPAIEAESAPSAQGEMQLPRGEEA